MRRGYVDTRLGQLHYAHAGPEGAPALVLLPQGGRSSGMYAELVAELEREYSLYALDYPGSGWSDPLPKDTSFEDMAAAVVDAMEGFGLKRANLYGLHTGNKIAAALAADWPEHVSKLVLVGQSHSLVPSNERRSGTVGKKRQKFADTSNPQQLALLSWADLFTTLSNRWWDESLVRDLTDRRRKAATLLRVADDVMSAASLFELYRANFAFDLEGAMRRIRVPTLIIEVASPSEDRLIGRQGPAVASLIAGAELATLEEPDFHGNTLEHRAADLAALLREFLARA